jgi:hypothetical protein
MTLDAIPRSRLFLLGATVRRKEIRSLFSALARRVAFETALRIRANCILMSLVTESLQRLHSRPRGIELRGNDLARKPQQRKLSPSAFGFLFETMTASAFGGECRCLRWNFLLIKMTGKAFGVTGRTRLDARGKLDSSRSQRFTADLVASDTFEIVALLEFGLILESFLEQG